MGAQHKRAALKNHLVLPAHQMRVDQGQTGLLTALAHGGLALAALAHVKRRGIDHGQHLRPGGQGIRSRGFKPGVLTDQQPHTPTAHLKHAGAVAWGEIAALVKHLVVGQFAFIGKSHHLALAQDTGAVESLHHRHRTGAAVATTGVAHHHMQAF